jgi:serine/threonine protein kinase
MRREREQIKARFLIVLAAAILMAAVVAFRKFRHLLQFWKRRSFVGAYRLLDRIGSGGTGLVYRAFHVMDRSQQVAIKVIREELSSDATQRKRLLHEGVIVDQISHPHIVRVVERGEHHGQVFLAMEFLNGESLADRIEGGELLALEHCVTIMVQLTDAVRKVHSKGIYHRDLKPANVMLTSRDEHWPWAKLLDFGLAKANNLSELTQSGAILGTIHYFPPECVSGQPFDAASDVYCLGVLFYEMLCHVKPFLGEQPLDIIRQILESDALPPSRFRPEVSAALDDLVMSMIRRKPGDRPSLDSVGRSLVELRI